jgi:putative flippase GtrA
MSMTSTTKPSKEKPEGPLAPPGKNSFGLKTRLRELALARTDKTSVQFLRYLVVGGIAYAVDFGVLFILTEAAGFHYLLSAALSFLLGLVVNYCLSVVWVFPRRAMADKRMEFLVFAAVGLVGLGLNEGIIWFFTARLKIYYLLSKIAASVVVLLWNFFARKRILFR